MDDDKDAFLREIDELLDGVEDETPSSSSMSNGVGAANGLGTANGLDVDDLDFEDTVESLTLSLEEQKEPPKSRLETLREAIANHQESEFIKTLFEDGRIPNEVRVDLWKECLGASRRSDTIGTWSGPLDCENQEVIHTQCLEQAGRLISSEGGTRSQEEMAEDMEMVITFYCKSRNLRYAPDCGWAELLLPFLSLSLPRTDLFNCFYAMMNKYIPKECRADGKPFYLFRLLLLYHDPELCSFLDTKKLSPDKYLQPWLRSMFAGVCEIDVTRTLWDHYFMERDPFFFFFLTLVLIVNAKELLMQDSESSTKEQICSSIFSLPLQLCAEDIEDFFSLANYYASRTPQSFRKDYHSILFGGGRSVGSLGTNITQAFCLPISLQEIIDSMNQRQEITDSMNQRQQSSESSGVHYVIVDCRPLKHFSCGHLPGAHNLDANLLLHSPSDFSEAADRLCTKVKRDRDRLENGDHLCFLGSGREQEDQYVTMVVAKFLQKSTPYVSLARGGFLELVSLHKMNSVILEDFDPSLCKELYSDDSGYAHSTKSDASDSDSESYQRYRQKLQAKGAQLYSQMATGFSRRSQNFKAKLGGFLASRKSQEQRHVSQSDRPSKRYRNVHADVFVIADEDDNENLSVSSAEGDEDMVNIGLYCKGPDASYSFPAVEIYDAREYPSHILLTSSTMIVLRELSDREGWGKVKYRHALDYILKITAKKKHPDVITFRFGTGVGEEAVITDQLRFRIPNTSKATDAIKTQILKCQEGKGKN